MEPRIESVSYHCGAPAMSKFSRTPCYRIDGRGFGNRRGRVEFIGDDDARKPVSVQSWSDTYIEVDVDLRYLHRDTWRDCLVVIRAVEVVALKRAA